MPIYDYRCAACGRRFTMWFQSFAEVSGPRCAHCGSTEAARLAPRVAVLRSEESRLEGLADPSALGDVDERDPRSVARWARKLAGEMGEDLGDDLEQAVEEAAKSDGTDMDTPVGGEDDGADSGLREEA